MSQGVGLHGGPILRECTINIIVQPDMLHELCDLYMSQGDGLHGGPMLRECINHPELAEVSLLV